MWVTIISIANNAFAIFWLFYKFSISLFICLHLLKFLNICGIIELGYNSSTLSLTNKIISEISDKT